MTPLLAWSFHTLDLRREFRIAIAPFSPIFDP